jgi:hypothetical protein
LRIGFISADWGRQDVAVSASVPGGSGWARIHMPARWLADRGHMVAVGHGGASLARHAGAIIPLSNDSKPIMPEIPDVVVMQRVMDVEYVEAIPRARAYGQVVVQDLDDWFWGLDKANKAWWGTHPDRNPTWNRDLYLRQIELSDAVTTSTAAIGSLLRNRTRCLTPQILLRNVCDMVAYETQVVRPVTDGLVVGWVGALGWRSGDLETLRGVLDPFLASCGGSFVHHGTFPPWDKRMSGTIRGGRFVVEKTAAVDGTAAERAGVAAERAGPTDTFRKPWLYPELVRGFDIGVVPLSRQAFNYAKSWIKGLEYAAAGIPFVAQRTDEYEALGCGLLADTPKQWRAALEALRDPGLRAQQRALGLDVARRHDLRARGRDWESAYAGLLAARASVGASQQ